MDSWIRGNQPQDSSSAGHWEYKKAGKTKEFVGDLGEKGQGEVFSFIIKKRRTRGREGGVSHFFLVLSLVSRLAHEWEACIINNNKKTPRPHAIFPSLACEGHDFKAVVVITIRFVSTLLNCAQVTLAEELCAISAFV